MLHMTYNSQEEECHRDPYPRLRINIVVSDWSKMSFHLKRDSSPQNKKYILPLVPLVPSINRDCFGEISLVVASCRREGRHLSGRYLKHWAAHVKTIHIDKEHYRYDDRYR